MPFLKACFGLLFMLCVLANEKRVLTQPAGTVAFSAGLTQQVSLTPNTSVAFDRVWLNIGDGYDNTTGIFTCPVAGTYVFMYSGLAESAGTMWLDLYRNGQYQISGYAHNSADYASAGNSGVLTLAYGDTVYIRGQGTVDLYGATDEVYCTFSGYLLIRPTGTGVSPATTG